MQTPQRAALIIRVEDRASFLWLMETFCFSHEVFVAFFFYYFMLILFGGMSVNIS